MFLTNMASLVFQVSLTLTEAKAGGHPYTLLTHNLV